ncbi:MAG: FtsX-like permease family protein [archaeon GB-1867-035]|nr:FtsX-like permease family protein [Candidatus Culexmicrobium profundum]
MERYKEIGTMKCLGAKSSLLLTLFIIESSIIGILGGTMGFVIASLLSIPFFIFTNIFPSAFSYLLSFILSISISLIVSLIATIYPAYYAIRINPADALRFEV